MPSPNSFLGWVVGFDLSKVSLSSTFFEVSEEFFSCLLTFSVSKTTEPCLTLSPTFTRIFLMIPSVGDGISMEALSDSTVIKASSLTILSPSFTRISITSTLSKFPISGISTVKELAIF